MALFSPSAAQNKSADPFYQQSSPQLLTALTRKLGRMVWEGQDPPLTVTELRGVCTQCQTPCCPSLVFPGNMTIALLSPACDLRRLQVRTTRGRFSVLEDQSSARPDILFRSHFFFFWSSHFRIIYRFCFYPFACCVSYS